MKSKVTCDPFTLYKNKKYDDAIKCCNQFLQKDNFNVDYWNLLGLIFLDLNQFEQAQSYFKTTLQINPNYANGYFNLGVLFFQTKDFQTSAEYFLNALNFIPENPEIYNYLGIICTHLGMVEDSINFYQKCIQLDKKHINATLNIAKNYLMLKEIENAFTYFQRAIKIDKNCYEAHFGLAQIYFLQENYNLALEEYEYRTKIASNKINYDVVKTPRLKKQNLNNKKLLVYYEQGHGDNIQFIRYIDNLYQLHIDFEVVVHKSLLKLFQFSFPNIVFKAHLDDESIYNYSIPIMSLPYQFSFDVFTPLESYLKVDKKDVLQFKQKYINPDSLNIGIVWQGLTTHVKDKQRSITLDLFKNLINDKKNTFYSLQIENYEEIENIQIVNLGKHFTNFYDTAVAIESLDLIISIDTSVCHLAGALGKKCFVLIPYVPDWRWGIDGENKWYSNMKLLRQDELNNWESVLKKIEIF